MAISQSEFTWNKDNLGSPQFSPEINHSPWFLFHKNTLNFSKTISWYIHLLGPYCALILVVFGYLQASHATGHIWLNVVSLSADTLTWHIFFDLWETFEHVVLLFLFFFESIYSISPLLSLHRLLDAGCAGFSEVLADTMNVVLVDCGEIFEKLQLYQ